MWLFSAWHSIMQVIHFLQALVDMKALFNRSLLEQIGIKIIKRKQTVAIAESVTSGLFLFAFSKRNHLPLILGKNLNTLRWNRFTQLL